MESEEKRPVGRPPKLRPEMDDSRSRAAQRAAELLDGGLDVDEIANDEFKIDLSAIPDGWDYEWKRHEVLGAKDPSYEVDIRRMGWEPVPADRHPEMMPVGYKGVAIERKGMILMERPAEITRRVRDRDAKAARDLVRTKEEALSEAAPGQFERVDGNRSKTARISKSVEPMAIPE